MYGTRTNLKTEVEICKIIRQHISEAQIDANYHEACRQILPDGCEYDEKLMEAVIRECRKMALNKIPKEEFTLLQIMYIRQRWGIDV